MSTSEGALKEVLLTKVLQECWAETFDTLSMMPSILGAIIRACCRKGVEVPMALVFKI